MWIRKSPEYYTRPLAGYTLTVEDNAYCAGMWRASVLYRAGKEAAAAGWWPTRQEAQQAAVLYGELVRDGKL